MFGLFKLKQRKAVPSKEQLATESKSALAEVKEKWIFFNRTIHLSESVSLAQKIDVFSQPLSEFFRNKYPPLLLGGSELFWLTIFTAILESGTHPKEEVNDAIAELQRKFDGTTTDAPIRAPLAQILPSFVPVLIEKGVPGYEAASLTSTERHLNLSQVRALLAAAAYFGVLGYAGQRLDSARVEHALKQSLHKLNVLNSEEKQLVFHLIEQFYAHKVIRESHPFDDWLCEAWWSHFQTTAYHYPSAMSDAIAYGLTIRQSLGKCSVEY